MLMVPQAMLAQEHIVSPVELHRRVQEVQKNRKANLAAVRAFLGSDLAKKALKTANVDSGKLSEAVAVLSDSELARLAGQTAQIEKDFAAGRLTNTQITYIILGAIGVAIIAIVAAA
jgi:hypothetical protein